MKSQKLKICKQLQSLSAHGLYSLYQPMGSTTHTLGVTHQFELHFVVTLLECEDKEYEHRHVQHEGYQSVVTVQEQEEVLGGRRRRKRAEWDRWEEGGETNLRHGQMQQPYCLSSHAHQVSP